MPFNFEISNAGTANSAGGLRVEGDAFIGGTIVDNFEDYGPTPVLLGDATNKWSVPGSTGAAYVRDVAGLDQSNQGLSLEQFVEPESYGSSNDSLQRYPSEGDTIHFRILFFDTHGSTPMFRFHFAKNGTGDNNYYRYEINLQDDYHRLERITNGSRDWQLYAPVGTVPMNSELECRIHWYNPQKSSDFVIEMENIDTNSMIDTDSVNEPNSFLAGDGIQLRNNGHLSTYLDEIHI